MKINDKSKDSLGDWCKWLEKNFSPEIAIPKLPVIIRLDGNNFHNWVKGLEKPFDMGLVKLMQDTTKYLVKETNAIVGYCQSDEITLILFSNDRKSQIYNNGKKQKILSKLTSKCVNYFNERRKFYLPNHNKIADFDCRFFQTPTLEDATLQLLWRENDATRNSILGLSYSLFSHNEVEFLNTNQLQDKMMLERGVNWNDLIPVLKRGTYFKRKVVNKPFTQEEIDSLPEKHQARKNPNLVINRSVIDQIEYPIFSSIKNKVDVIFYDSLPEIE
jgi:tRNA(His) 5'-end guanylyltransferase